jgi:hypothetical protein
MKADYLNMAFYSNYEDKYDLANMILKEEIQRCRDDCHTLALEIVKGVMMVHLR